MEAIGVKPTIAHAANLFPIVIDEIVYDVLKERDLDSAIACLTSTFTCGEPMTRALGITEREFNSFSELICTKAVTKKLSVAARDERTGILIGCQISEEFSDGLIKDDDPIPAGFLPILALLQELDDTYLNKYPMVERDLFHAFMVGVDKQFKGKNVGYHLVELSNSLGHARGFSGAIAEATGPVSQHILIQKHHWQVLGAIPYHAFRYQQKPVFRGITACESCQLVYKRFGCFARDEEGTAGIARNASYAVVP